MAEKLTAARLEDRLRELDLEGLFNFMGTNSKGLTLICEDPFMRVREGLNAHDAHILLEGIAIGHRFPKEE